jgi:spore maturation protein CgeB
MRTFEVPACGSFMLAERSEEQRAMFVEDREAVFFSNTEELCDKVRYYLAHDDLRRRIAQAGFDRVTSGRNTYRDRLSVLMDQILGKRRTPAGGNG